MTEINKEKINKWLREEFKEEKSIQNKISETFKIILSQNKIRTPILRHIIISNYSYFNKTINFSFDPTGFTLIIGSNISGKSTFVDLLKMGITGEYRKNINKLMIKKGADLYLSLFIEYNKCFYEINPYVVKNRAIHLKFNSLSNYDPEHINLIPRESFFDEKANKADIYNKIFSLFYGISEKQFFDDILQLTILHEKPENLLLGKKFKSINTQALRNSFFNQLLDLSLLNSYNRRIKSSIEDEQKKLYQFQIEKRILEEQKKNFLDDRKSDLDLMLLPNLIEERKTLEKRIKKFQKKSTKLYKIIDQWNPILKPEIEKKTHKIQKNWCKLEEIYNRKSDLDKNLARIETELRYQKNRYKIVLCQSCLGSIDFKSYKNKCLKCNSNQTIFKSVYMDYEKELIAVKKQNKEINEEIIGIKEKNNELNKDKLKIMEIDDRLKNIIEINNHNREKINKIYEQLKFKKKDIIEIKSELIDAGKYEPINVDKIDEKMEILDVKIDSIKRSIIEWKGIENRLFLYNKQERIQFFDEFNRFFSILIKKIFKIQTKLKFNFDGSILIENGMDFENDFSGAETRLYEIAFRLTLFKFFKKHNFNFPLIIENCEKHLDDALKENLANTLIWFNKKTDIPIVITSYDERFYKKLLPNVKGKKHILSLNDYVPSKLLPEQITIQTTLINFLNKV